MSIFLGENKWNSLQEWKMQSPNAVRGRQIQPQLNWPKFFNRFIHGHNFSIDYNSARFNRLSHNRCHLWKWAISKPDSFFSVWQFLLLLTNIARATTGTTTPWWSRPRWQRGPSTAGSGKSARRAPKDEGKVQKSKLKSSLKFKFRWHLPKACTKTKIVLSM